jgi:hypothetical protein
MTRAPGACRLWTTGAALGLLACSSSSSNSTTPADGGTSTDGMTSTDSGTTPTDAAAEANACPAGKISCSGTCIDPGTDDGNCGGCGLSCPGGCAIGECKVTLATGSIVDFDVAGSTVYFIEADSTGSSDSIASVPVEGGTPTTILSALPYTLSEITADSANVYFTYQDSSQMGYVAKATISGGTITTIASNLQAPSTIGVTATTVYWVDGFGNLGLSPIATPSPQTLTPMAAQAGTGLALGSTDVYWASANDGLVSAPLAGGQISTIFTGIVFGVAVDSSSVYMANNATDNGFQMGNNAILKAPVGGGTPTTLVDAKGPMAVVADGASVYWVDYSGTLMKVALKGSVVSTLVGAGVDHLGGEYGTHALAVDSTSVYVATGTGTGSTGAAIVRVTPK